MASNTGPTVMDLDLRLFRYFVVLADERHFARAAERLSITPPTLTHQIKALEARLGVRLCNRKTSARLELTEAGRRFLDQARHVLRQAEEAELAAQKAARGEIGSIEIGYMMSVATSGLMQKYVGAFRRANPGIDVNFRRMPTITQVKAIVEGTLDVGFARPPSNYPPELAGFRVFTQPLVVAVPADHPLARRKRIAPMDLKDEPFITTALEIDFGFGEFTEAVTKLAGYAPTVVKRASDAYGLLTYVACGFGVGVIGKSMSKLAIPNVAYRDLAVAAPPQSPVACFHRRNETAPATLAFIRTMGKFRMDA
jgi:DNA-binding transcriptional LysR family regulator